MITTKPLPGATIDYLHPINRGLSGWWLFNERAGSRIADISGNGNHGNTTNVDLTSAWGGSLQGGSLSLDGVDDRVVVTKSQSLSPLTSISVVGWVNGPTPDGTEYLFSHYDPSVERAWAMRGVNSVTSVQILLYNTAAQTKNYRSSLATFDGTWHQTAFTFDGPSSTLKLYGDGQLDSNPNVITDDAITELHDADAEIRFGSRINAEFWKGSVSDLRIYNRALTAGEIRDLHVNPYAGLLY